MHQSDVPYSTKGMSPNNVKQTLPHYPPCSVLNGQNQDGWKTNQNQ